MASVEYDHDKVGPHNWKHEGYGTPDPTQCMAIIVETVVENGEPEIMRHRCYNFAVSGAYCTEHRFQSKCSCPKDHLLNCKKVTR